MEVLNISKRLANFTADSCAAEIALWWLSSRICSVNVEMMIDQDDDEDIVVVVVVDDDDVDDDSVDVVDVIVVVMDDDDVGNDSDGW